MVQIRKKKRSECRLSVSLGENKKSGAGELSQPTLLFPTASSVTLGLQQRFKFEFQRREPRACARGGAEGRARLSPHWRWITWPCPGWEVPKGSLVFSVIAHPWRRRCGGRCCVGPSTASRLEAPPQTLAHPSLFKQVPSRLCLGVSAFLHS